jgi:hypothetical protein
MDRVSVVWHTPHFDYRRLANDSVLSNEVSTSPKSLRQTWTPFLSILGQNERRFRASTAESCGSIQTTLVFLQVPTQLLT